MNTVDLRARRERAAAEADWLDAELDRCRRRHLRIELENLVALINQLDARTASLPTSS
jgi:hypothetical protein